jgi:hypothetical protein
VNRNDLISNVMTVACSAELKTLANRVDAVGGDQGTPECFLSLGFIPEPRLAGKYLPAGRSSGSLVQRWCPAPGTSRHLADDLNDDRDLRGEFLKGMMNRDYPSPQHDLISSTRMSGGIRPTLRTRAIKTLAAQ